MIKYRLICKSCKKSFDSWFSSSKQFEKLKKMKLLNCNYCNSLRVTKSLMAPNVLNNIKNDFHYKKSINDKKFNFFKREIKKYQKFIKKNLRYVGENFAYEARTIHYNSKKKSKGIYGKTTKEEIKELRDEGIETYTIPWVEDKDN
tara:strand:+ start:14216 stop:14653 length:438 start_codon:yes stop_codon:yes gene_type:complete